MVIGDTRFKQSWIPIVVVSFAPRGTAEGPITKLCSKFLFVRSERPEIPDINNQNKGSLMETNVTETLLDSPYPSEAILAAIKLIDFSWMDWIRILNTQCCPYSEHRDAFRTSASMQAESLATSVYDNDPCDASLDLARRIEALRDIFKYAILEVNDQFWARAIGDVDIAEFQDSIGLVVSASSHQRITLEKQRQELNKCYNV